MQENPHYGANIKKLKGKLEGYYRYRVGNYRLFYLIEDGKLIVAVVVFNKTRLVKKLGDVDKTTSKEISKILVNMFKS